LDQDGVGVGVKIGLGLEFRNPAAENLVGNRQLAGLVVDLDDDVLAKILQRDFLPKARAEIPDLVRPLLELLVVSDAALERNGLVFGSSGRFSRARRVASLAMLDHFGGTLERPDLADAGHIFAVPLHAELEVLVGIEALRVDAERSHGSLLRQLSGQPSAGC